MAGTTRCTPPRLFGSRIVEFLQKSRSGAPLTVRISTNVPHGISIYNGRESPVSEGPSCIFIGPIETASQETLEALYRQARDAYYSGTPLIVDDMFDRVELKLRWYGSKSVVKYPRCSIRRQSTYADAEEDLSQVFALASVWILILAFGSSVCLMPVLYTVSLAYREALTSGLVYGSQSSAMGYLNMLNGVFCLVLGALIGYPIASASVKALQGLWRNDLVALKGSCPNCGEEVFAFVSSDQNSSSPIEQIVMYVNPFWNFAPRLSNRYPEWAEDGFMDVYIWSLREEEIDVKHGDDTAASTGCINLLILHVQ